MLGMVKTSDVVNLAFKVSKASWHSVPQTKDTPFFVRHVSGIEIFEKS